METRQTIADAEVGEDLARGIQLAEASVEDHEIGPWRILIAIARGLGHEPREAPAQHLTHHAEIVARGEILGADIELSILVLGETLGACNDHHSDRLCTGDVAVVIDLDAPRRLREPEHFGDSLQQSCLGGRFGEPATQRFARVDQRVIDECPLVAALRHRYLDAIPGSGAQGLGEQGRLRELVGQQHTGRADLILVKLREETFQDFARPEGLVRARVVRSVAPVLIVADEEHLDAGNATFLVNGEYVGLVHCPRMHSLVRLDRRQGR